MIGSKIYLAALFAFLLSCNQQNDPDPFSHIEFDPDRLQIIENIGYGRDGNQVVDLYLPANRSGKTKLLFYIHGGGWYGGDKQEVRFFGFNFLQEDYAIVAINYRLTNTPENHHLSEQLSDIQKAIDFTYQFSDRLDVSDENSVIMGSSAGGHLGLLYAYGDHGKKKIKAVIAMSTPVDLTDPYFINAPLAPGVNGGDIITWLLKDTITVNPESWKKASPLFSITKAVPTFFIHGSHDNFIPPSQPQQMVERLQAKKIPSVLLIVKNAGHNLFDHDLTKPILQANRFIDDLE